MSSRLAAFPLLSLALLSANPEPTLRPYEAVEPHMGTLVRIKLYAADQQSAQTGFQAAFARVAQLDNMLSDYKADSELNLATKAAVGHPVHISDELMTVLEASQKLSVETAGAFDVTVGPLTKLWRSARKDHRLPDADSIAAAKARCGYQKLHLDATAQTMTVDSPDMQLDLGAIGKGYAADEALQVLIKMGIRSALVAASGDLVFGDRPPDQPGWKIGIDSLDRADKPFTRVLTLNNSAVSTSGGSEQNLEIGGQRYSHIIDPKTGMGLTTDLTVTAIAKRGIDADGADTAINVLGCSKGLAFAENHSEIAVFILDKTNGQTHVMESTRFKTLYANNQ